MDQAAGPIPQDRALLAELERLALAAGRVVMDFYRNGGPVESKADHSPVTAADRDAEAVILDGLRACAPGIPVVAEEETSAGRVPAELGEAFFLVDPLDGTREFVNRRDDFTVNIALVRRGEPVCGVVYAPARQALWSGSPGHAEAATVSPEHAVLSRRTIRARPLARPPVIVASHSHRTPETDAFIARYPGSEIVSVGSSLKFCLLARGEADIYPRFGRTMEWDTAAGDAVLRAAGGRTMTLDGKPLAYGKRNLPNEADFANPHFVAEGRPAERG